MPKKSLTNKHIVLDLDSTLICSDMKLSNLKKLRIDINKDLRDRIYRFNLLEYDNNDDEGTVVEVWGVYRPHLFEFIKFCSNYFAGIHIWSAGTYKYVHGIKEVIFKSENIQPITVFTRDDCEMNHKNIFKPLSKFFNSYGKAIPENTLIVDDRDDTFSKNRSNGILIPRYDPNLTSKGILDDDVSLLQLMKWLSLPEVKESNDVRKLDKSKIFIDNNL